MDGKQSAPRCAEPGKPAIADEYRRDMATILVVEDHALSRQMLKSLLGYLGHRVLEAADGSAALALARSGRPDLVISDIAMPTMDGIEFAGRLRADARLKDIPVIFYTAMFKTPEARGKAEAFGNCRVIEKPSEPAFILRAVGEMLGSSDAEIAQQEIEEIRPRGQANYDPLHGSGLHLAALMDFSFHLVGQRDPARLLDAFCRAAQEVLRCEGAVLGLVEEETTRFFLGRGDDGEPNLWHPELLPPEKVTARVMNQRATLRHQAAGMASLTVPFSTSGRVYGWFSLMNKRDRFPFGDEDEEMAVALSAQAAIAYENILLSGERKRKEEEIEKLNDDLKRQVALLEAANKELEGFSYSVSHDLRAPLRHMTGFMELLNKRLPETLDEKSRRYLNVIWEAARHMGRLVDDLLLFARMGRVEMVRSQVDLNELVTEAILELQLEIKGRQIAWNIAPLPGVRGDRTTLRLVLVNLIANAVKFTRQREQAVVEIGHNSGPEEDVFYVKDNGAGFDQKYVAKLFTLFQRLHRPEEFEGTGVGLANVRRIITRHGGRTWAEGAADRGAAFYFSLPKQKETTP